jgi:phosphodiesterase/alkaline phosphatase D-like protein
MTVGRGEKARGFIGATGTLAAAVLAVFAIAACSAHAGYLHPSKALTIGPDGTPVTSSNSFGEAKELAIDQSGKRLYVFRSAPPRGIYGFDLSDSHSFTPLGGGFPISLARPFESHLAADEAEGNIFFSNGVGGGESSHDTLISWTREGQLRPSYPVEMPNNGNIAVDPFGYVWLAPFAPELSGKIYKIDPDTGALLETLHIPIDVMGRVFAISFDRRTADMWLEGLGPSDAYGIVKFTAVSNYQAHEPLVPIPACGIRRCVVSDSRHGELFVRSQFGGGIYHYTETGDLIDVFGGGADIAFDEESGTLFAVSGGSVLYWPGVPGPEVETGSPAAIGSTQATLSGRVSAVAGGVVGCRFEFVTKAEYDNLVPASPEGPMVWPHQAPCEPPASPEAPITSPTDVTAHVTGLTTGETYIYRLSASNANGRDLGNDETFVPNATTVKTGEATEVTTAGAKLNGLIDPEGLETTYYFQYGTNREYGQTSTAPPGVGLGTTEAGEKPASAPISGLTPGTVYHYRLVAVNSKGTSYGSDHTFKTVDAVKDTTTEAATEVDRTSATLNGSLDPDGLETHYYFQWGTSRRYGQSSVAPPGTLTETSSAGQLHLSLPTTGLAPQRTYHFRIVATNARGTTFGNDLTFTTLPAVKDLETEPATDIGTAEATLNGSLDPDGYPTSFYFQWGKTTTYGHAIPLASEELGSSDPGLAELSKTLENLEPGTTYHYRLAASNSFGTTIGADQSFQTPQPPSIEGIFSSDVSADSARLRARINPHGAATTYRFEYGTTPEYGSLAPVPEDGTLGPLTIPQPVSVSIEALQQGTTYHFRLTVESQWGSSTSEDQTFEFEPPNCPNAALRQQTGAAYLPDCRAYELVSPARAGGAVLSPGAPSSPYAHDNFAFGGTLNIIPGAGNPPNGGFLLPAEDLYVARRTASGWVTRYVGLSGEETLEQSGKPTRSGPGGIYRVLADRELTRFLTWDQITPFNSHIPQARSFAPYVWDNEGNSLGRLPSNLAEVPGASAPTTEGGFLGDMQPSADFSHYAFSSIRTAFAPGGLTESPGSAYDEDLTSGEVQIVSKTAAGADIPIDPQGEEPGSGLGGSAQFLQIPALSTDGSHILISSLGAGGETHLYMRVGGALTYEVSRAPDGLNHAVSFAGMSADGGEVFFTTPLQMSASDQDSSIDLYRWAQATDSLTLLSTGVEGSGNRDECNTGWIAGCGVEVVPTPGQIAYSGGNPGPPRDTALAADSEEIYFYSPEQLDLGARGVPGKRNLYLWQGGAVRFLATIDPEHPIEHINVSADGSHMGFITKTPIGSYDNAGHAEMFVYDAQARALRCVSCHPDGSPPSSDVEGAQNGIFMTDDGRAFFSTEDALIPRDANGITDVYEYVEGRPQLISSGAGTETPGASYHPGLVGVSADGTNAFFYTTQTYVPQDENGAFFKFYDARVAGGFPYTKPPAPCAAADECHGEASTEQSPPQIVSGAQLGALGNYPGPKKKHRRRKHRRGHAAHRHPDKKGRNRR